MSATRNGSPVNRLLDGLPAIDRRRMLAKFDDVELVVAEVLYNLGETLNHVYFPLGCVISLIMPIDDTSLEVGLIGNEGMFGIPVALGIDVSPVRAVVQGAGSALRMGAASFRGELRRSPSLQCAVDRYAYVRASQLAQMAGCTRFHLIEARLARWLLMTQDRAHASSFNITQNLLAVMLGVRRVGVTKAAGALQKRHLIRYRRGRMTVLDRRGLKTASCGCYDEDRRSYERILG